MKNDIPTWLVILLASVAIFTLCFVWGIAVLVFAKYILNGG